MSNDRLSDSQIALVLLSDNETAPLVKAVREIVDLRAGITAERAKVKALREAAEAALAYDAAIAACANSPDKMASFCTVAGDDLDALYTRWQSLSRAALATSDPIEAPSDVHPQGK